MSFKYIALANFTANVNGEHKEFKPGDEIILPVRHYELDTYINPRDLGNHTKSNFRPYGLVVVEEVKDEAVKPTTKPNNK